LEELANIKNLIRENRSEEAIALLEAYIIQHPDCDDMPFYLLGNAYRKQSNWQMALNNYLEAIDRNPDSPAFEARKMTMDILEFYNKDMFNQ
jgi:tetratricopeptide (TPR) repeat protein